MRILIGLSITTPICLSMRPPVCLILRSEQRERLEGWSLGNTAIGTKKEKARRFYAPDPSDLSKSIFHG